jgi:hypothetical protein
MRDDNKTIEPALAIGDGSGTINIVNVCQLAMMEGGIC